MNNSIKRLLSTVLISAVFLCNMGMTPTFAKVKYEEFRTELLSKQDIICREIKKINSVPVEERTEYWYYHKEKLVYLNNSINERLANLELEVRKLKLKKIDEDIKKVISLEDPDYIWKLEILNENKKELLEQIKFREKYWAEMNFRKRFSKYYYEKENQY